MPFQPIFFYRSSTLVLKILVIGGFHATSLSLKPTLEDIITNAMKDDVALPADTAFPETPLDLNVVDLKTCVAMIKHDLREPVNRDFQPDKQCHALPRELKRQLSSYETVRKNGKLKKSQLIIHIRKIIHI